MSNLLLNDEEVAALSVYSTLYVGFSGGLDSTVLLHVLSQQTLLRSKLVAVHVHHGLSANADEWQMHCEHYCRCWSIALIVKKIHCSARANIEESARLARYAVFSSLLSANDALVLAHHQDDQAETLLLQLFRGAGVDGLAAMAKRSDFKQAIIIRPLLENSREQLLSYAKAHALSWVEDESNKDTSFSRNYLRQTIFPLLRAKWPTIGVNLARSAQHCQEAKIQLEELALLDAPFLAQRPTMLPLQSLMSLTRARLKNVLRFWLKANQFKPLSAQQLAHLIDDVIYATIDATPVLWIKGRGIRRYQQCLYIIDALKTITSPAQAFSVDWPSFPHAITLPGLGRLEAQQASSGLVVPKNSKVDIRLRQGGELIHWHGKTRQLKKLFQAWHIPPWQRDKVPLVYIDNQLAVVVGYAIADAFYHKDKGFKLYYIPS